MIKSLSPAALALFLCLFLGERAAASSSVQEAALLSSPTTTTTTTLHRNTDQESPFLIVSIRSTCDKNEIPCETHGLSLLCSLSLVDSSLLLLLHRFSMEVPREVVFTFLNLCTIRKQDKKNVSAAARPAPINLSAPLSGRRPNNWRRI